MTEYAAIPTADLTAYAQARDNRTSLEVELARRLETAMAMIEEAADDGLGGA